MTADVAQTRYTVILVLLCYAHALQIMNYMNSPSYNPPATSTWAEPSCRSQLGQSSPHQLEELRANSPKQVLQIAQVHTDDMVPGWMKGFQMLHLTLEEWCFPGIGSLQWAVRLCSIGGMRRPQRGNPGNSRFSPVCVRELCRAGQTSWLKSHCGHEKFFYFSTQFLLCLSKCPWGQFQRTLVQMTVILPLLMPNHSQAVRSDRV